MIVLNKKQQQLICACRFGKRHAADYLASRFRDSGKLRRAGSKNGIFRFDGFRGFVNRVFSVQREIELVFGTGNPVRKRDYARLFGEGRSVVYKRVFSADQQNQLAAVRRNLSVGEQGGGKQHFRAVSFPLREQIGLVDVEYVVAGGVAPALVVIQQNHNEEPVVPFTVNADARLRF
ncbi:hypothetical protein SDC9_82287 [bioreactor metagenome]|uniref:Uncharacterized protein n=1 Tax=bioreactor metagenome TaxID=1076179 RepID=A0A644ZCT3_9ZZZZ